MESLCLAYIMVKRNHSCRPRLLHYKLLDLKQGIAQISIKHMPAHPRTYKDSLAIVYCFASKLAHCI